MKRLFLMLTIILLGVAACQSAAPEPIPMTSTALILVPTKVTQAPSLTSTSNPTSTSTPSPTPTPNFSFAVTSDMAAFNTPEYIQYPNFFAALLTFVKQYGPGDFMVSPGDITQAADTRWTIDQILGEDYLWYPIIGNHDFSQTDLDFFENYPFDPNGKEEPNIVNWGPEPCNRTTYSFDYQNAHFVALNVYCTAEAPWGIDGSITDSIYNWLEEDLSSTKKEHIFVFGHEPAFPQPDAQTGSLRHHYESLDQYPEARDRFWSLLQEHGVLAYINGHTHGFSLIEKDGVWQVDAGHAMGTRAGPSPGTFLLLFVEGQTVRLEIYRGEQGPGFSYYLSEVKVLRD